MTEDTNSHYFYCSLSCYNMNEQEALYIEAPYSLTNWSIVNTLEEMEIQGNQSCGWRRFWTGDERGWSEWQRKANPWSWFPCSCFYISWQLAGGKGGESSCAVRRGNCLCLKATRVPMLNWQGLSSLSPALDVPLTFARQEVCLDPQSTAIHTRVVCSCVLNTHEAKCVMLHMGWDQAAHAFDRVDQK